METKYLLLDRTNKTDARRRHQKMTSSVQFNTGAQKKIEWTEHSLITR
jgi:hypothetical protein